MKKPIVKSRSQKILDVLVNHDEFKHEFAVSRKLFLKTAKESVRKDGSKYLSQWNSKVLEEETSRIMNMFVSLPDSWEDSIRNYIKTGALVPPASSTKPKIMYEEALPLRKSKLIVQVFKHTTKKEYVEAWKSIELIRQRIWEIDPKPLTKRDLKIIKKYKQGKTAFQTLQEIPDDISPSTVRKVISKKAPQLGVTLKTKKS